MSILIALLLFLTPWAYSESHQATIEYVEDSELVVLREQFNNARPISKDIMSLKVMDRSWSCAMYGVKSRIQKANSVKLYRFSDSTVGLKNFGAQVVKNYKYIGDELVGSSPKIKDQIRILPDGRLISRLQLKTHPSTALAYSTCVSQ